jgi:succinyl-diaminopimelate desuccinylase
MDALDRLSDLVITTPDNVATVIQNAQSISEPLSGVGEAEVLKKVTVNFGRIEGGVTANLVADQAEVNADIRIPMGCSVQTVEIEIKKNLTSIPGIQFEITRRYEPSWTQKDDPIVVAVLNACQVVLDSQTPVVNMRVGASDARLYRAADIPTVVCGLTPYNLGGPDEFVDIDELVIAAKIHTLAALNFLASTEA